MKPAAIIVLGLVATSIGISPVFAQQLRLRFNTDDPALFLAGEADSCQGCDLSGITLAEDPRRPDRYRNIQMRQADMSNATLRDLNLSGAYFTCADLSGADLSGADLSDVDFLYTDLSGANLSGANVSSSTFRGAVMDANTNLDGITIDDTTIAPNSLFAMDTEAMNVVEPIPFDNRPYCVGRSE
ncbi:MAG: pentapeptide repeat-containing protein [Cyanobacteriota bacterium]|nr:pentapeptide repeat-containing protein [Cyanobacteriota bacterium]